MAISTRAATSSVSSAPSTPLLKLTPAATLNDLVRASVAAYGGPGAPALGSQWRRMDVASAGSPLDKAMQAKGFFGQAHVNSQTGEVIIADRGTIFNMQNLISDAHILLGAANHAQPVADSFASAALASAQNHLSPSGLAVSAIYTTGHSLGGAESQGQAAMLSSAKTPDGTSLLPAGVKITNVSIDAPGIADLAKKGNTDNYASYNFYAHGDLVNLAGGSNLAGTRRIPLEIGPPNWKTGGLLRIGAGLMGGMITIPFGVATISYGLYNTVQAHSYTEFLKGISGTALGNTTISQLNEKTTEQIQSLFHKPAPATLSRQRREISAAPDIVATNEGSNKAAGSVNHLIQSMSSFTDGKTGIIPTVLKETANASSFMLGASNAASQFAQHA